MQNKYEKIKIKRLLLRLYGPSEIYRPLLGSPGPRPIYRMKHPLTGPSKLPVVNNPTHIYKVSTLPPIGLNLSDHDTVYVKADIWLKRVRERPRKVYEYTKANRDIIKLDLD